MKYILIVCLMSLVSACSDDKEPVSTQAVTNTAEKMKDNVFKDQVQVLDKAKGVEDTVMQQAQQQRKDIDEKTAQ
jgi:hypothetical protein